MKYRFLPTAIALAILLILSAGPEHGAGPVPEGASPQVAVGNAFTYQGELSKTAAPSTPPAP